MRVLETLTAVVILFLETLIAVVILFSAVTLAPKQQQFDTVYEGKWNTSKNKKLDGRMTCKVTKLADDKYKGNFYGVWHGSKFNYTVDFKGSTDKLKGKASIDGVDYDWTGKFEGEKFVGSFTSGRYIGSFSLKEKGNKK